MPTKSIYLAFLLFILPSSIQAQTLSEISSFAASICGKIPFTGSNKASDFKTRLKGQLDPMSLKKILGVELSAEGTYAVKGIEYEGLPFDSLPSQVNNERECKKEMALFIMSGKMNITEADEGNGTVVTKRMTATVNDSYNRAIKIGSLPAEYEVQGMTLDSGSLYYRFTVSKPTNVNIFIEKISNKIVLNLMKGNQTIDSKKYYSRRKNAVLKDVFLMPGDDYYISLRAHRESQSTAFKMILKGVASR